MRLIRVPDPVKIDVLNQRGDKSEREVKFADFIGDVVNNTPLFGKGIANIRKANRIMGAIESLDGKTEMRIDETDWMALKDAAEGMGWMPAAARKYIGFYDAIDKAEEIKT